jgi:hypothetical protein
MKRGATWLIIAMLLAAPLHAAGAPEFADWTDTAHGTLSSSSFTMTDLSDSEQKSLSAYDLTDTPFLASPGAGDQEALNYLCLDDWTVTFGQAMSDLRLYAIAWRGVDGGVTSSVHYTFNHPVTIESGFTGASLAGSTLTLPDGDFYDGILRFTGSFNSLTVTSDATLNNAQAMTFSAAALPEPSTTATLALAAVAAASTFRTRRQSRSG